MHKDEFAIWELQVHWYPEAAKAEVEPTDLGNGARCDRCELAKGQFNDAAFYMSYSFWFANPPSREDFLAVMRRTPWAQHSYEKRGLLKIVADKKCPWPIIDSGHKAGWADIKDDQGSQLGKIDVRRHFATRNPKYGDPFVSLAEVKDVLRQHRIRGVSEVDAETWHGNAIRERILEISAQHDGQVSGPIISRAIREVLTEVGIIKPKKSGATKP